MVETKVSMGLRLRKAMVHDTEPRHNKEILRRYNPFEADPNFYFNPNCILDTPQYSRRKRGPTGLGARFQRHGQ